MQQQHESRLLTQPEAARLLGISIRRVQEERAAGRLAWVAVERLAPTTLQSTQMKLYDQHK